MFLIGRVVTNYFDLFIELTQNIDTKSITILNRLCYEKHTEQ